MVILFNILYYIVSVVIGYSLIWIPFVVPELVKKYRIYKQIESHFIKHENLGREKFEYIEQSVKRKIDDKIKGWYYFFPAFFMIVFVAFIFIVNWWFNYGTE